MNVIILAVVIVACVVVGREIGKWVQPKAEKLQEVKKDALELAIQLRANGLRVFPSMIEALVLGDAMDLVKKVHDFSQVAKNGNEAIVKELNATFDRVLEEKLKSPEGRAVIAARLQEAVTVAKVVAPIVAAAVV
jgi:hypothetical protein